MTGEPEYTYVKGQGWVISTHAPVTFEAWGCRITLTERRPELGEWYFIERSETTAQTIAGYLQMDFNAWRFDRSTEFPAGKFSGNDGLVDHPDYKSFVMTYERIDG